MFRFKNGKIFVILVLATFISIFTPCFADELPDDVNMIKVSDKKNVKIDDKKEIKRTLKNFEKYIRTQNFDGMRSVINDSFVNNDGFSKDDYIKMIKKTSELYPDLKGSTDIQYMRIDGNTAEVLLTEHASGKISNKDNELEKNGKIKLTSEYIVFLQKYASKWSIQSIYTVKEKTVLLYSDALLTELDLVAPNQVAKASGYCARLSIKHPKNIVPFASIANDKIEFPPKAPEVIFKNVTSDGVLERVVNANSDGKNECVVATVGMTRPTMKNNKISIKITGMAIIMTRVNVIGQKQNYTAI